MIVQSSWTEDSLAYYDRHAWSEEWYDDADIEYEMYVQKTQAQEVYGLDAEDRRSMIIYDAPYGSED